MSVGSISSSFCDFFLDWFAFERMEVVENARGVDDGIGIVRDALFCRDCLAVVMSLLLLLVLLLEHQLNLHCVVRFLTLALAVRCVDTAA